MSREALIKTSFNGKQFGERFRARVKQESDIVGQAAVFAARKAGQLFQARARANMKAGGDFGSDRWQNSITYHIEINDGILVLRVEIDVPFWRVFEYGAVIRGNPLLWIPLGFANIPKGMFARDYPGQLFRIERKGKAPLLLDSATGEPKFFAKESVTIPKKWTLRDELRRVMNEDYPRLFMAEKARLRSAL